MATVYNMEPLQPAVSAVSKSFMVFYRQLMKQYWLTPAVFNAF